jgi:hypothetical protein
LVSCAAAAEASASRTPSCTVDFNGPIVNDDDGGGTGIESRVVPESPASEN